MSSFHYSIPLITPEYSLHYTRVFPLLHHSIPIITLQHGGMITGGLIRKRVLSMTSSRGKAHNKLTRAILMTRLWDLQRNLTAHFRMYLYLVTCFVRVTVTPQLHHHGYTTTVTPPSLHHSLPLITQQYSLIMPQYSPHYTKVFPSLHQSIPLITQQYSLIMPQYSPHYTTVFPTLHQSIPLITQQYSLIAPHYSIINKLSPLKIWRLVVCW